MARSCTICGHPARADIEAALTSGLSLDAVVAEFGLPSRSALNRHRVSHLGRPVTFHLLPTAAHPTLAAPTPPATPDPSAVLDRLFDRTTSRPSRSLQDYARLVVDGLAHIYAAAQASGDHNTAVRALRELRALLQFHALVPVEKLQQAPGWYEPPTPRDPAHDLLALLLADGAGATAIADEALATLDARYPGFACDWRSDQTAT